MVAIDICRWYQVRQYWLLFICHCGNSIYVRQININRNMCLTFAVDNWKQKSNNLNTFLENMFFLSSKNGFIACCFHFVFYVDILNETIDFGYKDQLKMVKIWHLTYLLHRIMWTVKLLLYKELMRWTACPYVVAGLQRNKQMKYQLLHIAIDSEQLLTLIIFVFNKKKLWVFKTFSFKQLLLMKYTRQTILCTNKIEY